MTLLRYVLSFIKIILLTFIVYQDVTFPLLHSPNHAQDLLVSLDLAASAESAVDVGFTATIYIVVVVILRFVIVVVAVIMVGPSMKIVNNISSSNK